MLVRTGDWRCLESQVFNPAAPEAELISCWSRDGKFIYFCSYNYVGASGLVKKLLKIGPDGGNAISVAAEGFRPTVSPDGRFLYYAAKGGLWRMPVDGGSEELVLGSVSENNFAVGRKGIYFTPADRASILEFFDFATQKTAVIADVAKPIIWGLALSPDARSLLYARTDQESANLMLIDNFR